MTAFGGTFVTESGPHFEGGAAAVRRANSLLAQAQGLIPPLRSAGLTFTVPFLHFGAGRYPVGEGSGLHTHPQLQLEYVTEGRITFFDEKESLTLQAGEGVLIPPGVRHGWRCEAAGLMLGLFFELRGPQREVFLRQFDNEVPAFRFFQAAAFHNHFASILQLLETEVAVHWLNEQLACYLGLWVAGVLNEATSLTTVPGGRVLADREDGICRCALEFMQSNYGEAISLRDVALQVGLSARHLNRLMRKRCSESVGEALLRIRMEVARQMLIDEPDIPIKAVAYRCGFAQPAYFTARYRRHFDETPTQVRLSHL